MGVLQSAWLAFLFSPRFHALHQGVPQMHEPNSCEQLRANLTDWPYSVCVYVCVCCEGVPGCIFEKPKSLACHPSIHENTTQGDFLMVNLSPTEADQILARAT